MAQVEEATDGRGRPPSSDRTRVRRRADRGRYEPEVVDAILDEALICHVAFVDGGQPFVLPTIGARLGSTLYFHGALANRMLKTAGGGGRLCVTATIVDGIVFARSAFHHSMNYRSVVILGEGREVTDPEEKVRSFEALVEHVARGRWAETRPPNAEEIRATRVVAVDLGEASAKVRTGPPLDDEEDLALGHWAGVLPLRVVAGTPEPDPLLPAGVDVPPSVDGWTGQAGG